MQKPQLVGYGVDTLILNMRYTDEKYRPIKKELAEEMYSPLRICKSEGEATGEGSGYWDE